MDLGWGVAAEHGGGAVVDDVGDDVHEGGPVVEGGLGLGADESQLTQDRLIGTFRDAVGPGRVRCGEVVVTSQGNETYRSWALNEVTLEKSARERMLEVVIEVDSRPVSSFGCDGVLVATPTGSTAYAFSVGGPVIWPNVEALMMIPLSAHALFARPLVVGPQTQLAIEVLRRSSGAGVLWCDGRRTFDLPPGSRVEVRQSGEPVPMVVLEDEPFADRIVKKFSLPVTGWRGPDSEK